MPPRSPTSRPASRPSWSRGRMPAANTTMSASRSSPSANESPATRPSSVVRTAAAAAPVRTSRPSASTWRRRARPPPSSSCTAIRRGANSTTVVADAEQAQGVGGLEPEQAAADDDAGRRAGRPGADGVEVVERAVDERAGGVDAGDRRDERERAGGDDARPVGDLPAARGGRRAGGGVEGDDGVAEHELDAGRVVQVGRPERQLLGVGAVEDRRQVDPVVGPAPLLADDDEGAETVLDGRLDEAVADHAVADDEDRIHVQTPSRRRGDGRRYVTQVTARQTTKKATNTP